VVSADRRGRALLAGLVAVGVGVGALVNLADDRWSPAGPTSVAAPLGEDARVDQFRVHVTGASAARELATTDRITDEVSTIETDGVWVVVELSYAGVDDARLPWGGVLRDARGREYPVSSRAGSDHQAWMAGTDLWVGGQLVFELPADALDGLSFRFWPESPETRVPLGYGVTPLVLGPDDVAARVELVPPAPLPAGERS
jgi:hypothetical protein